MTVQRIIGNKGPQVSTVPRQTTVREVLDELEAADVGAVVVSSDGAHVDGIVSERDIVRGLRKYGPALLDAAIRKIMTTEVVTCDWDDPIISVMARMDDRNIRHVPVLKKGKLAGMLSIKDIVSDRLRDMEQEASSLNEYIKGSY